MAFLISILLFTNYISYSNAYTFERVNSIILDYDWAEGITQMAFVNGQVYIPISFGYDIYAVDLSNKQNIRRLGGQGKGPGEFDKRIASIYQLNKGFAVTDGNWIHFFNQNGKFENRIFLKTTSILAISKLAGEQLLVGTKSYLDGNELNTISNVGIMKSRTSDTFDYELFGNSNKIENMNLNTYVIDSDERFVVIGQIGSNELRFHRNNGSQIRKLTLAGKPNEITFRNQPQIAQDIVDKQSEILGYKLDYRLPSFGIVFDIVLTPQHTIVQGVFDHNGTKKSHAIVSHSDWSVDYVNLGASCRSMTVENDMMYCLNAPPNKTPQIDIYRIKVN